MVFQDKDGIKKRFLYLSKALGLNESGCRWKKIENLAQQTNLEIHKREVRNERERERERENPKTEPWMWAVKKFS